MYEVKFLTYKEKAEVLKQLEKQFGITSLPEDSELIKSGKENKLTLFTGNASSKELEQIRDAAFVESIGMYLGKVMDEEGTIRLSIEGVQILKDQISKNILELNADQMREWMEGKDLFMDIEKRGVYAIRYNGDFLGTGKASETRVANFVPKERRLREKA